MAVRQIATLEIDEDGVVMVRDVRPAAEPGDWLRWMVAQTRALKAEHEGMHWRLLGIEERG